MEETTGQQYALQIAVQTMKERCLQLQQRLSIVEEENMNLRIKYHTDGIDFKEDSNKSGIEILHQKIAQLTKQKSQLTHNVLMVATENRQLWTRLSKLTQANQTLGDRISKINDTLNQSIIQSPPTPTPSTLIRSKTFTHETPPPKLVRKTGEENYSDTSLEDISLKIINSIAQEKFELEKQCEEMTEMQAADTFLSNSIGFAYPYDVLDECVLNEFAQNMEKLIYIKDALIHQRDKLKKMFNVLKANLEDENFCKGCKERHRSEKESLKFKEFNVEQSTSYSKSFAIKQSNNTDRVEIEKICPVCSKMFKKEQISELLQHVVDHFAGEEDAFYDFEAAPVFTTGLKK